MRAERRAASRRRMRRCAWSPARSRRSNVNAAEALVSMIDAGAPASKCRSRRCSTAEENDQTRQRSSLRMQSDPDTARAGIRP
ncbi:MAG: hypothetical protein MZV65_52160 [Chromatiales bacterium]|nr:hypothetical protein [Chromatiales bacterium]